MTPIPTQVTFHGLAHSDALEAGVRERVSWLEQFYPGLMRCRVLIDLPHRHRQSGREFHVRIDLTVAGGGSLVVSHEPPVRDAHLAVHQAFDAARRQLEDFAREQRGSVKTHEARARADAS